MVTAQSYESESNAERFFSTYHIKEPTETAYNVGLSFVSGLTL